jgi:hypothetical protein
MTANMTTKTSLVRPAVVGVTEDLATASNVIEDVAAASDAIDVIDAIDATTRNIRTADRNKLVRVSNIKLDSNAFQFKQNGEPRCSPNAAYVAKSTACSAIISTIKAAGNKKQQALAFALSFGK